MLTYQNDTVRTSVRKLVEFLLRNGSIVSGSALTADPEAMQEGSRLHRKIQRAQKASYQSEVPLKMTWSGEEYQLVLEGRADGIDSVAEAETGEMLKLIDEIKCVYKDVSHIEEAEPLHLAQAKCYAYMYAAQCHLSRVLVQLTYCNIETEEIKRIVTGYDMEELEVWFYELIDQYRLWADYYVQARKKRNQSIAALAFPFSFRPGQKKLTAIVYQAVEQGRHVFLQAPTGVGKTMSTLYPVLKEMSKGKAEKIFYLTAKTITRTAAENALFILKKEGMILKALTMTAKEKICVQDKMECDPEHCERAKGHYDRINRALYELLHGMDRIDREKILEYSARYMVCPYELSVEAAIWADCVICDYNYIFDPHVNARGMFGSQNRKQGVYLIDEAHNLLDRAREMYSADLKREEFLLAGKYFRKKHSAIDRKIKNCLRRLANMEREPEHPEEGVDGLYFPFLRLLGSLEDYLKDHPVFEEREEIVQFFFRLRHFFMVMEYKEKGYQIYTEGNKKDFTIKLFCVDPSSCLSEYLERSRAAIFFSATLLPAPYYKQLLGGSSHLDAFSIPSPFPKEHRLLAVTNDVTSRYSKRGEEEYRKIIRYLEITAAQKPGNYMVFFPSYAMLNGCAALAEESTLSLGAKLVKQESSMGEREREQFLEQFEEREKTGKKSLIGFCVLGSIFSEGIDLTGSRLIGVLIVGTGLPQICKEREMIRAYFDMHDKKGYDYAYRYPGMNKVLQAAGRVIRTSADVGIIVLMDDRFLLRENQMLLPVEWDSYYEVSIHNYPAVLKSFWEKRKDDIS